MILVWVILIILLLVFLYILFAPFYIEINSIKNIYQLRFHKLAVFSVNFTRSSVWLDIKILFWETQIDLLSNKEIKSKEIGTNKKTDSDKSKNSFDLKKIKAIMKSFKINKCDVNIDTGNMQLNGLLFPLVYFINRVSKKNVRINFMNENIIILEIENNMARIARSYLNS